MPRHLSRWQHRLGSGLNRLTQAVLLLHAYLRRAYRFAHDVLDRSRTLKPRMGLGDSGDAHPREQVLSSPRETCRDTLVALRHVVNNLLTEGDLAVARRVLRDFMKTRGALRTTHRRTEPCRGGARMARIVDDGGPDE